MQWTVETWWQWIRQGSREHLLTERSSGHMLLSAWWLMGQLWAQAPIWSLHASFMELSEVIFQNWLLWEHVEEPTFSGWLMKEWLLGRGVSALGKVGLCRGFLAGTGYPQQAPLHPRAGPPSCDGALYHFPGGISCRRFLQSLGRCYQRLHGPSL